MEKREGLTLIPQHIREEIEKYRQIALQSQAINLPPQAITPQNTSEDRTPKSSLKHNSKVFIPGSVNQIYSNLVPQNPEKNSFSGSNWSEYLALQNKKPKN